MFFPTEQQVRIIDGPGLNRLTEVRNTDDPVEFSLSIITVFFFGLNITKSERDISLRIRDVQRIEGYVSHVKLKTIAETTAGLVSIEWMYNPTTRQGILIE